MLLTTINIINNCECYQLIFYLSSKSNSWWYPWFT